MNEQNTAGDATLRLQGHFSIFTWKPYTVKPQYNGLGAVVKIYCLYWALLKSVQQIKYVQFLFCVSKVVAHKRAERRQASLQYSGDWNQASRCYPAFANSAVVDIATGRVCSMAGGPHAFTPIVLVKSALEIVVVDGCNLAAVVQCSSWLLQRLWKPITFALTYHFSCDSCNARKPTALALGLLSLRAVWEVPTEHIVFWGLHNRHEHLQNSTEILEKVPPFYK